MIVKKFVGETFHEACQKIKDELGSDAMILQTNRIKVGGFLGFFGRWMFEVIAQANAPVAGTPPHGIPAGMMPMNGNGNVQPAGPISFPGMFPGVSAAQNGTAPGLVAAFASLTGANGQNGQNGQNGHGGQHSGQHGGPNNGAMHPGNPANGVAAGYNGYAANGYGHANGNGHANGHVYANGAYAGQGNGGHAINNVTEISQPEMTVIRAELDDLKKKIDLLVSAQLPPIAPRTAPGAMPVPAAGPANGTPDGRGSVESVGPLGRGETHAFREMMDLLTGSELEPGLRGQIRTHLLETSPEEDLENLRTLKDRVIDYLSRSLISHKGIDVARGTTQKVIAVVGPTGVGKTTTLAKLGAGLKFNLNLEVGFLTLDTYRIAAPEQLKKYGEIIDVPVEVVFRPENLCEAIKQFQDKDVVLIDTAGRNSKNRGDMLDLVRFLDCGVPVETYLVLSANTKYSDLVEIIENFKDLAPTNLILTKLDETSSFGSMISLLSRTKKGVSYVTTGQNVPEDIMPASPAKLARLLFERRLVA